MVQEEVNPFIRFLIILRTEIHHQSFFAKYSSLLPRRSAFGPKLRLAVAPSSREPSAVPASRFETIGVAMPRTPPGTRVYWDAIYAGQIVAEERRERNYVHVTVSCHSPSSPPCTVQMSYLSCQLHRPQCHFGCTVSVAMIVSDASFPDMRKSGQNNS